MKQVLSLLLSALLLCGGCAYPPKAPAPVQSGRPAAQESGLTVQRIDGLPDSFIMGADVSSLIAMAQSGAVYYGFDGQVQDPLLTLGASGINYVRVRLWFDPFDSEGHGYGGGNCTVKTAAELGKRAAEYGMKLLVDFHMSDFWADPSKQQPPKAWAELSFDEKAVAMGDYVTCCLAYLKESGADVGMVQVGNETNNGFCGETELPRLYSLLKAGCAAVRDFDPEIKIAVHYTNPESGMFGSIAQLLDRYGVDYDVFAASYYPYRHGSLEQLARELSGVAESYGKQVMVAETAWPYTLSDSDGHGNTIGGQSEKLTYPVSVQGQADAISAVIRTVFGIGDRGIGVFYWEPAWIAVPAESQGQRAALWEKHGSGWASSYGAEYDPTDAGLYYGGSAWDNQALFDSTGHPLESLKTFSYVKTGTPLTN